jgi:hypothetical protein
LYKSHSRLDIRKYSFTQRTVEIWNDHHLVVMIAPVFVCYL